MADEVSPEALRRLVDRQEILDCITRLARAMDRWDRDLARSAYHPGAVDDHGQIVGDAYEVIDWAIAMHERTHTSHQHSLLNHTCEIDGDVAHTETYYHFLSLNVDGPPWSFIAGRYVDRLERRDERWGIVERTVVRDFTVTDVPLSRADLTALVAGDSLPPKLLALARSARAPMRDRTDPSYDRPLTVSAQRIAQSSTIDRSRRPPADVA